MTGRNVVNSLKPRGKVFLLSSSVARRWPWTVRACSNTITSAEIKEVTVGVGSYPPSPWSQNTWKETRHTSPLQPPALLSQSPCACERASQKSMSFLHAINMPAPMHNHSLLHSRILLSGPALYLSSQSALNTFQARSSEAVAEAGGVGAL